MSDDVKKQPAKAGKPNSKLVNILIIAAAILVILMGPYYLPGAEDIWGIGGIKNAFSSLEQTSVNWRFVSKALTSGTIALGQGATRVPEKEGFYKRLVIAAIDSESEDVFGRWPFDRKVHGELLNYFNGLEKSRRPDLVFFDVIFKGASNPVSDKILIDAFRNYESPLAEDIILTSIKGFHAVHGTEESRLEHQKKKQRSEGMHYSQDPHPKSLKRFELDPKKNFTVNPDSLNILHMNKVEPMLPELAEGLDVMGAANMDSSTATIRKKPLIVKTTYYTNRVTIQDKVTNDETYFVHVYYPDIVLAMTVQLLDSHLSNVLIKPGEVVIRNALVEGKRMDYRIPVDDRLRLNINYKASVDSQYIRTISYKDMFRSGLPRNSVVMVGLTILGGTDVWLSPLGNMSGIYHLAYALGTVMNQDYVIEVPQWLNMIYTVLFTLLIVMLISRGIRSTVLAGLVGILVPLVIGFVLFQFNIEIVTMIPLLSGILTLIAGVIYLLLTEEKEKKFIKNTFSSYVNPELVDILIQNPDMMKLGGDSKDLTILFSDIRSFTTMSEGMTPEYLIDYLNVYLTRMTDIVMESQGTLDKYIGDAVMAFWGAPIELKDHALAACRAAVQMMEVLPVFNEERAKLGDKPIDIGIGLNSNVVNVGNVGSEKRKNYTVIGDGVNLASRLEGANKYYKTNIIISEYTYEKVKDHVIARELDLIRVKGKNLPVKIYELIAMKA